MDNGNANAVPTAEDWLLYETAREELMLSLQKKRIADKKLAKLEAEIYNSEGAYLTKTAQPGGRNIVQRNNAGRRRHGFADADRAFSNSSMTHQKSLGMLGDADADVDVDDGTDVSAGGEDPLTTSGVPGLLGGSCWPMPGLTTFVVPPPGARAQQESAAQQESTAQQKKARDKEYQRRKRAAAARDKSQAEADAADGEDCESMYAGSSRRPNKKLRRADDD